MGTRDYNGKAVKRKKKKIRKEGRKKGIKKEEKNTNLKLSQIIVKKQNKTETEHVL